MWIAQTIEQCRILRQETEATTVLVPTMGALHAGHVAHIEAAQRLGGQVIVSIFVNPTQFSPSEDFDRYPRPIEADLAWCRRLGVSGVFLPDVEELYPPGQLTSAVSVPAVASMLEGAQRPGHFDGVCRIVAKLFHVVAPDMATFGRKDYQQLVVVQTMVADLNMPIRIIPIETVREADGLAASSRNVYLNDATRPKALGLHAALQAAKHLVANDGAAHPDQVESTMREVLSKHDVEMDYAVVRDTESLAALPPGRSLASTVAVALVAGRVGGVRLIDNLLLDPVRSRSR